MPVDVNKQSRSRAVFLVDTSLSANPERFGVWLQLLKALLDANRAEMREFAVGFFDIRSNLAHPSTYVIDKQGNVQLAYVGADMSADRPSVNALLDTIRAIGTERSE